VIFPEVDGYVRKYTFGIVKQHIPIEYCEPGDIIYGGVFYGSPTGGTAYLVLNGRVVRKLTVAYKPWIVTGFTSMFVDNEVIHFQQYSQTVSDLEINITEEGYASSDYTGWYNSEYDYDDRRMYTSLDTFNVKYGWYFDFVPDAGEGTYCGQLFADSAAMYTHPGWPI
jgi:hypothetical protein